MNFFLRFLEALTITFSLSIDTFVCSFAYGVNKIKIPLKSVFTINFVCCVAMAISVFAGNLLANYIPLNVTTWISFACLVLIGLIKLFAPIVKNSIKKRCEKKESKMLLILTDNTTADKNKNKVLSPLEAVSLAFALSIDSLAVGFSAVVGCGSGYELILAEFITDFIAINLGAFIGKKVFKNVKLNLSWLSGVILIVLAVVRLTLALI